LTVSPNKLSCPVPASSRPIFAATLNSGKGENMEEIEKAVLEAMKKAGKPVRPGDVAKSMEMDSKEVSKVIDSLKKKGMVVSPKRCYYAPSDS
jgi:DNA-binding MarR family transcriptional regulator